MWGLMALFSGGYLAKEAIRKSRIPEYATVEFYLQQHPNMSLLDITKLRNQKVGTELSDEEVKMLVKNRIPIGMWHQDKQPLWDRFEEERRQNESLFIKAQGLSKEDQIKLICRTENSLWASKDEDRKWDYYATYKTFDKQYYVLYNLKEKDFERDKEGNLEEHSTRLI